MKVRKLYNAFTTYLHIAQLSCMEGVKLGKDIRLCGRISFQLSRNSKFIIGDCSVITGGSFSNALGCLRGSCIRIDDGAQIYIGESTGLSDVSIWSRTNIRIGNNVTVGAETIINDSNSHCLNYQDRRMEHGSGVNWQELNIAKAPIVIEDDVFIGARCIINKGVTIGARAIVAAGSVVTKNIPADEIWGGNPSCFIRKL